MKLISFQLNDMILRSPKGEIHKISKDARFLNGRMESLKEVVLG